MPTRHKDGVAIDEMSTAITKSINAGHQRGGILCCERLLIREGQRIFDLGRSEMVVAADSAALGDDRDILAKYLLPVALGVAMILLHFLLELLSLACNGTTLDALVRG